MDRTPKQDLRFIKNEALIQKTFREMIAENEYSRISIKELTESSDQSENILSALSVSGSSGRRLSAETYGTCPADDLQVSLSR